VLGVWRLPKRCIGGIDIVVRLWMYSVGNIYNMCTYGWLGSAVCPPCVYLGGLRCGYGWCVASSVLRCTVVLVCMALATCLWRVWVGGGGVHPSASVVRGRRVIAGVLVNFVVWH
jgi:hypothetical protein